MNEMSDTSVLLMMAYTVIMWEIGKMTVRKIRCALGKL